MSPFALPAVLSLLSGALVPEPAPLVISEFRVRGPNGANDEFVEIYNASDAAHTVAATDGSGGYALAASDGAIRFTIPNGTVIPARGHYLGVNSVGYSLASYPAGGGATATGDATYTSDIPDNAGLALFSTATAASFALENRLDAVGSTAEASTLYREGAGYPALTPFSIDYSWHRKYPGMAVTGAFTCLGSKGGAGLVDTGNNANDFLFEDTNGTSAGGGQRLGAPAPENLSSPVASVSASPDVTATSRLDPASGVGAAPNFVRDLTSSPAQNSTFGTVDVRRVFKNTSAAPITRLRFRVVDLSTFPSPSGVADLRGRTSSDVSVSVGGSPVTVMGTTIEQPPSQPNGTGFNSTFSATGVSDATPLAAGASIPVRFLLGIQQTGRFVFAVSVETIPATQGVTWEIVGSTDGASQDFTDCWPPDATATAVVSSQSPADLGQSVTFTATVTSGDGTPTGTVTFLDGGEALGTGTLDGSGQATLTTSALTAGSHAITARYEGTALFGTSTSAELTQLVRKSTAIALTVEDATVLTDAQITLTATLTSTEGGAPQGSVVFLDGATALGTAVIDGSGVATLLFVASKGSHTLTATYEGSADFSAGTSDALVVTASDAPPADTDSGGCSSSGAAPGLLAGAGLLLLARRRRRG